MGVNGLKVQNKFKNALVAIISVAAMYVASAASSMCIFVLCDEAEMPKSLYKRDEEK